jgi:hypothetical protein
MQVEIIDRLVHGKIFGLCIAVEKSPLAAHLLKTELTSMSAIHNHTRCETDTPVLVNLGGGRGRPQWHLREGTAEYPQPSVWNN